jgi:hypothetical protein
MPRNSGVQIHRFHGELGKPHPEMRKKGRYSPTFMYKRALFLYKNVTSRKERGKKMLSAEGFLSAFLKAEI